VKRPSDAGLEPKLQARSRDASRPTTGTADVNPGQAAHNLLKNYPGDPTRASPRHSVIAIPTSPSDIGVLPVTYANHDGSPGPPPEPSSRVKFSQPVAMEEAAASDGDQSPTDTRCPQLQEPFDSSERGISSLDFALSTYSFS